MADGSCLSRANVLIERKDLNGLTLLRKELVNEVTAIRSVSEDELCIDLADITNLDVQKLINLQL